MVQVEEKEHARLMALDAAVRKAVSAEADDICWRDLYTDLARLVGIDFCPALMASREQFLANCGAFDASLRGGGKYRPVFCREHSVGFNHPLSVAELLDICQAGKLAREQLDAMVTEETDLNGVPQL